MAMAIPLLIANTGIGATIATSIGVSATTLAAVTSVAFQVTGINDKINKAASKVFGEDLVKVANIAAIGFGIFNGGLEIGGASGGAEIAASSDLFTAPALTESAWDAAGVANTDAISSAASMSDFAPVTAGEGFKLSDFSQSSPLPPVDSGVQFSAENNGVNLLDPQKPVVADSKPTIVDSAATATPNTAQQQPASVPQTGAAARQATAQTATGAQATASQAANAQAAGNVAAAASPTGAASQTAAGSGKSIFDRLFTGKDGNVSPQLIGGVLQGVGQGYASAQQAKALKDQKDEEMRRRTLAPNYKLV